MGTSHGDFTKYPRMPHLFGSRGTDDDKHLGEAESKAFIADESLIVEEKLDGTNVGIHFSDSGEMVLQCRGHLITSSQSSPAGEVVPISSRGIGLHRINQGDKCLADMRREKAPALGDVAGAGGERFAVSRSQAVTVRSGLSCLSAASKKATTASPFGKRTCGVEAAGIEPASRDPFTRASTCVVTVLIVVPPGLQ
jgi:hypothetical protein